MKTLLVTGSCGFIGLNFIKCLLRDSKNILNNYNKVYFVDKMGYATKYNQYEYSSIKHTYRDIIYIDQDINSDITFDDNNSKWDVINFASESHVDNSLLAPYDIFKENSMIPASICKNIGISNIDTFYHISTDEVYSEIPLSEIDNYDNWFSTNSPIKPNNPYSASKAAQDCYLMAMRHTFNLNVKFIRMANQMPGRFQHPEKMLMASIIRILRNEPVKIYGNGNNIRQWTPVNITAKIIYDILCGDIVFDDIIHIANRNGIFTNNEIIDKVENVMAEFKYSVDRQFIKDRLGHDTAYALKTTFIIDSYFKECDLNESIRECVRYCLENKLHENGI
jgi:dTDP-glucose 4,6-dehydratase